MKEIRKLNVTSEAAAVFEMEQAVENMKRGFSSFVEYIALDAKLRAEKFKQYKKEGFSEAQALELCKGNLL